MTNTSKVADQEPGSSYFNRTEITGEGEGEGILTQCIRGSGLAAFPNINHMPSADFKAHSD